jgi:hypothetical protein
MFPFFVKSLKAPAATSEPSAIKVRKPLHSGKKTGKKTDKPAQAPDIGQFSLLLALLAERLPGGDFGQHNVAVGHHVAFAAGSYVGAGKVAATGRDGLMVADDKRREHRVHWREVTGHFAAGHYKDGARRTSAAKKRDAA